MLVDLATLWRSKLTLAFCLLLGAVFGAGYVWFTPKTFEGQARVIVEPRSVVPESSPEGRVDPEFLPTQAEMIRSPITIRRALDSVEIPPPDGALPGEFDAVQYVLKSLKVTPVFKANVLTVSYKGASPEEVLGVISGVIDAYQNHVTKKDQDDTSIRYQIIESGEKKLRKDLEEAQREYSAFLATSPAFGDGRNAIIQVVGEAARLDKEVSEVRRRRLELSTNLGSVFISRPSRERTEGQARNDLDSKPTQDEHSALSENPEDQSIANDLDVVISLAELEDAQSLERLRERLRFAKVQVKLLEQSYGKRHPSLIAAKAELTEVDSLLKKRFVDVVKSWERQLQVLTETESKLEMQLAREKEQLQNVNVAFGKEAMLRENISQLEQLHSVAVEQMLNMRTAEEAIANGRTSIEVRILEGPVLLPDLTWPNPKLLIPASSSLGLLFGICFAFMRAIAIQSPAVERSTRAQFDRRDSILPTSPMDLGLRPTPNGANV